MRFLFCVIPRKIAYYPRGVIHPQFGKHWCIRNDVTFQCLWCHICQFQPQKWSVVFWRAPVSVEQIGDFCNPKPVQNFYRVIQSDHNPVYLSKYLIQSGLYPKNPLIKNYTAVINNNHPRINVTSQLFVKKSNPSEGFAQARNQLGTPGGAKSFLVGAQILSYVQSGH